MICKNAPNGLQVAAHPGGSFHSLACTINIPQILFQNKDISKVKRSLTSRHLRATINGYTSDLG